LSSDTTHGRRLPFTIAGVAALLGIWYGLPSTPVQNSVCEHIPATWNIPTNVCSTRKLTARPATATVDEFLGRAGGSTPSHGFAMLAEGAGSAHDFDQAWSQVLFAERVGAIRPTSGVNRYRVTYRTYSGPDEIMSAHGTVNEYWTIVSLVGTAVDAKLKFIGDLHRIDGTAVRYAVRQVAVRTKTYNDAALTDPAAPDVAVGQRVSSLCETTTPTGVISRTGWGWIRNSDLAPLRVAGARVPQCDPHFTDAL
jgi:hypothetical protein